MGFQRRFLKFFLLACVACLFTLTGLSGCQQIFQIGQITNQATPFPTVAALPLPELPDWITEISPTGDSAALAQIRILFKHPLIPVAQLESPQETALLQNIELIPAISGRFRFLTPKMIGFQADQPLPKATRFRVTLKAGLQDLENHHLTQDLAWTFQTPQIRLSNLPGVVGTLPEDAEPMGLEEASTFSSNTQLDLDSLNQHTVFVSDHSKIKATVMVQEPPAEIFLDGQFDPEKTWQYSVKPRQPLQKASQYTLEFQPGIVPDQGNLVTEKSFRSVFKTYGPLQYEKMTFFGKPDAGGTYGRFEKGSVQLIFSNGLDADSAVENISLSPTPEGDDLAIRTYPGSRTVDLNPWVLKPNTDYTITISKNLKDQYGQTLGKDQTITYNPGDVAAAIWAQRDLNIFPAGTDLNLDIETINLPDSKFQMGHRVVQPTDLVYAETAYPQNNSTDLVPPESSWETITVKQPKNQLVKTPLPIREKLGGNTGLLAYGITAKTNTYKDQNNQTQWSTPQYYGLVQLTNLGVFAQWFPESGLVRVHHLDTGEAVRNAQIEIYQSQLDQKTKGTPQACFTGQTDAGGNLVVTGRSWQRCLQGQDYAPELLVIAQENGDWAFTRTNEYSGAYGYGIYADWDSGESQARGTIFSDRQLYQPGETAYFTGVAYFLSNGELQQDTNQNYQVFLSDPEGQETPLGTFQTNRYGTFTATWDVPKTQTLGNYYLRAAAPNGVNIYGDFRVAEFRPPNFKVDLTLDQQFANMGDRLTATTQSDYLFGAPVSNSKVNYYVTRSRGYFQPEGWDEFQFGRQWHWSETEPSLNSDVLQTEKNLNDAGQSSQTIDVARDLPYPVTYHVEATVTDAANLSVSNTQTFTALPGDRLIGIRHDFVADAEKPFQTQVIVTRPDGEAMAGQTVKLELQKVNYSEVAQIIEGSQVKRPQVEYEAIASQTIKSATKPQTIELTAPESGSYRLHARINGQPEAAATDSFIWVSGDDWVDWGDRFDNNRVEVTLDKDEYKIGDTATALIQSPYPEAELYFSVIRHGVLYETQQTITRAAPQVQFTVTPEMLPNAAVEAVLIHKGESIEAARKNGVDRLMKIGFDDFRTSLAEKKLTVTIQPQQEKILPGNEQTLTLQLKDQANQPVQGQLTVMVVNEAILQLTGYRPPDLLDEIYRDQPITTRWADNRPDVTLTPISSAEQKGWGYDGGASAALANTRTRTDFKAIAYYDGAVLTNEQGQAIVKFTLPDDLTTWRVLVVATDDQMRFGNGDKTFIATQPLLSNPVLPQFARVGDRLEGGVMVTNTTGSKGRLNITAQLQGAMEFAQGNKQQQTQTAEIGNGTEVYRFPMVANEAGTTTFKVTTQKNGAADAFEVPLEVKQLSVKEQAIATGILTEDEVKIPLNIDQQVIPNQGGLTVTLASTLIPELTAPAQETFNRDDFPFLEPAASQLLIAANLDLLQQRYGQAFVNFDSQAEASQALTQLAQLQLPSGGFAAFPGEDTPDPYVTPYGAEAIALAQQAGFPVDDNLVSKLKTYLDQTLANPAQFSECSTTTCQNTVRLETLLALDQFGDVRGDFAATLYDARADFDPVSQIKLARHLSQLPNWQSQAQTLAAEVNELIYQTGRTAQINLPQRWFWYHSNTTAQAQALRLFVDLEQPPETLGQVVQGLLDQRRDGTWQSSYDNAQALTALTAYSETEALPPSLTSTVKLDRQQLGEFNFQGYENPSATVDVPMQDLPKGNRDLIIQKDGDGKLHYLSEFNYRLVGSQPGKLNGLRITRYIRPANQTEVARQYGLYDLKEPFAVQAGQVFDVGLEVIIDHPVDHVLISDPLPAGLEAIDTDFQTATTYYQPQQDAWQLSYQQIYQDKVVAYGDRLNAGVYNLHYLVRAITPGRFDYPGAEVSLQYNPETFGRSTSSTLEIN
ncbi:alpha-2-macroglobulin family protein [Synechococcus moorigangaii CMS01]|nr:alpha-2-macroglobulin family protein [Synechococcus moorigangaii CMS01]